MVETDGFEPTHPKEQIYSLPHLTVCAVSPKTYQLVSAVVPIYELGASHQQRLAVMSGFVPRQLNPNSHSVL